jgi:predicted unusual protein kinase regulating ubiquinone biosynthesis (AarF/ABC1/UbiB family)
VVVSEEGEERAGAGDVALKKLPLGRVARFANLARVGLRSGLAAISDSDATNAAKHAAEILGTMRGVAAKAGQMASYLDGLVPEKHRATYETALKGLQAAAPRSSPAQIRSVVEDDLGAPIDRLFAAWDDAPFASASIGEVHRATMHDGREVAVKVQHPGIARAMESDLANGKMLATFAGALVGSRFEMAAQYEVVRARFREELDYRLEAERILDFTRVHAGDETVRIVPLVKERSATRVLTTEFVRGRSFDEACAAREDERRAWAKTMWRFVMAGNLVGGKFNADPHPGNYLFHDDGVVTFLDFGCVQAFAGHYLEHARALHDCALHHDRDRFAHHARLLIGMKPGRLGDASLAYMFRNFAPLFDSPWHFTRDYTASLVEDMRAMGQLAMKVPKKEFFGLPRDMIFLNRLQFGFYSVLARLDVEVDYAEVERGFWHRIPAHVPA